MGYAYQSGFGSIFLTILILHPTLTIRYSNSIYLRGVQFTNLFRFLTASSVGDFLLTFLPHDSKFADFLDTLPDKPPPGTPDAVLDH